MGTRVNLGNRVEYPGYEDVMQYSGYEGVNILGSWCEYARNTV